MTNLYTSATLKLTAWYLTLVMAISFVFSAVVYHFATNELARGLSVQTERIYRAFPVFSGDPFFARSNDIATGSHHILLNLLYFNLIVLIIAGFASYWLAKHTLQPIESSNEQQRQFVADASHELRTPVAALKMSSEVALLDGNSSKDELRQALKSNLEEADKLDTLLSSLLHLSQLDSYEIRQSFSQLDLADVVQAAITQTAPQAEAKHIIVTNDAKAQLVNGDRSSLVQLLVILLDNALKYSQAHTNIQILSRQHQHTISVTVSDEGAGIPPSALAHVFDRFYRADSSRSGSQGFGLGLSIAKRIAELHHGSITLRSTVGKGTQAVLTLPKESLS